MENELFKSIVKTYVLLKHKEWRQISVGVNINYDQIFTEMKHSLEFLVTELCGGDLVNGLEMDYVLDSIEQLALDYPEDYSFIYSNEDKNIINKELNKLIRSIIGRHDFAD